MRTVAIIQARMGSTRLPGKVLKEIAGRTMLGWVVGRTLLCKKIDEIMIATTTLPADTAIIKECAVMGVTSFRGEVNDVLDRYMCAARLAQAECIVRITSDCPLVDPRVIDAVVSTLVECDADYASNTIERTYPRGLDVEAMKIDALEEAWRVADRSYEREHVTPYIWQNPSRFRLACHKLSVDHSSERWTVDTTEDLALIREIYSRRDGCGFLGWREVLEILSREPSLRAINAHTEQKPVMESGAPLDSK